MTAGLITHPANGLPFLESTRLCSDCAHFDAENWRCRASREQPTTAGGWPACARFRRQGAAGKLIAWLEAPHHALPLALAGAGAMLAYPLHLLLS